MFNNALYNSTDKRIIKFKMTREEKERLRDARDLKYKSSKFSIRPEVNDLYNKTKELIKLKR